MVGPYVGTVRLEGRSVENPTPVVWELTLCEMADM